MSTRLDRINAIIEKWGGLEHDQAGHGESEESLAERRYLVVEHGRDQSRRWFNTFGELAEALAFAAERAREDEWGFTAAYDLDTGEELKVEFRAEVVVAGRDASAGDDTGTRRPKAAKSHVVVRVPEQVWRLLRETLELDARSSAFDAELRERISQALATIECLPDMDSVLDAARDVLEWAEQTGGWDAPCWARLRQAVRGVGAEF